VQAREETPAIGASPCPNRPILCYASRVEAAAGAILAGSRSSLHYARPKKFYSSHACWSQAVLAGVQPEGPVVALAPRPQIAALRHGQCVVFRTRHTRVSARRHVGARTREQIRAKAAIRTSAGLLQAPQAAIAEHEQRGPAIAFSCYSPTLLSCLPPRGAAEEDVCRSMSTLTDRPWKVCPWNQIKPKILKKNLGPRL
jgi:hypothetical protein